MCPHCAREQRLGEDIRSGTLYVSSQAHHCIIKAAKLAGALANRIGQPSVFGEILVGLLLGTSMGASPVAWLLGSPLGAAVLVAGLAALAVGLVWTSRMVAGVERDLDGGWL